jgi:hypothetical protein
MVFAALMIETTSCCVNAFMFPPWGKRTVLAILVRFLRISLCKSFTLRCRFAWEYHRIDAFQ